jgi:hypothetical protein
MDERYVSRMSAGVEKKYRQLENDIMDDVVRRIRKTKKITSSADWQLLRYRVLGNSSADIQRMIDRRIGEVTCDELFEQVVREYYTRDRTMYLQSADADVIPAYEDNPQLQQLTEALIAQSDEQLFNISKSTGFMLDYGGARGKVFTPLSDVYNGYIDQAITDVASGAFDYNTMLRKVVKQMTDSGLRTVAYVSGRSNRVDVAARRAVMTGLNQLAGRVADMNAQKLGTDLYEVSWHAGARPDHARWQGKVYTRAQLQHVCGLGTGAGLLGWNCRHTYYPFILGVSERAYTDEWLAEQNRKEAVRHAFRDREYNAYEATQKQRQMETRMRAQRQKVRLLERGGADPDDVVIEKCKYQAQLDEYRNFSRTMKLPTQMERVYYDLNGRVAPT